MIILALSCRMRGSANPGGDEKLAQNLLAVAGHEAHEIGAELLAARSGHQAREGGRPPLPLEDRGRESRDVRRAQVGTAEAPFARGALLLTA